MRTSLSTSWRRTALRVLALVVAALPSCKSDHSSLAYRPHPSAGGMGGMAGVGGMGGRAGAITKPSVAGAMGADPDKHVDEPGRSVLTFVHGIVDAGQTVWCFARVRDGVSELVGDPVPAGGLAYGESLSVETLPHVDAETDGIAPYVITGDLARLDGLDCAAAVALAKSVMATDTEAPEARLIAGESGAGGESGAESAGGQGGASGASAAGGSAEGATGGSAGTSAGESSVGGDATGGNAGGAGESGAGGQPSGLPPALRVGGLPGLPAGTLGQGYSVLEVADGCFGALAFTDRREALICGSDYTPAHGSLSAEIVTLARQTTDGKLAMQALDASRAVEQMGVGSAPPPNDMTLPVTIVDNFSEGALRPRDPRDDLPSSSWGVNSSTWSAQMTQNGYGVASEFWSTIRRRAGISQLEDGRGYTVVALGPSPDIASEGFWNSIAFALVDNDPPVSK